MYRCGLSMTTMTHFPILWGNNSYPQVGAIRANLKKDNELPMLSKDNVGNAVSLKRDEQVGRTSEIVGNMVGVSRARMMAGKKHPRRQDDKGTPKESVVVM